MTTLKAFDQQMEEMQNYLKLYPEFMDWIKSEPKTIKCGKHPANDMFIVVESSYRNSEMPNGPFVSMYRKCDECLKLLEFEQECKRLMAAGVGAQHSRCTFDSYIPANEGQSACVAKAKEFCESRRGFLILIGEVGTGKTHLAVSIMRAFKNPVYRKRSTLLAELRKTYRDEYADIPIERCQAADVLVLDELGRCVSGRDELPMLEEILDYRYDNCLPTVLAGNLTMDELEQVLGPSLADRLSECAFAILSFGGPSRRSEMREKYFAK